MRSYAETFWTDADALRVQRWVDFVTRSTHRFAPHFDTGGMLWQGWEEAPERPGGVRSGMTPRAGAKAKPPPHQVREVREVGFTMGLRVEKWFKASLGRPGAPGTPPEPQLRVSLFGADGVTLALEGDHPPRLLLEGIECEVREAIEADFRKTFG